MTSDKHATRITLLVIILLAFFLRVWRLPETPPGLWYDEAYNALDALAMADSGVIQPFVVGNNGRETMWHILLIPALKVLGAIPFAVRLVGALAGVLTVPLMYLFARALAGPFAPSPARRRWFGVVAAGWLAVSWWHITLSRAGFRPILLPPLLMLCLYFFWRAARQITHSEAQTHAERRSTFATRHSPFAIHHSPFTIHYSSFALSGLFLGLAQYTYLPARLAPLIIGAPALLWSIPLARRNRRALGRLWLGVALTALVSALVFAPLGWFFLQNPETFSSRTGDVAFAPASAAEAAAHLLSAVSLFLGAGHELYRHHLPGRAMLGWLEIPFFLLGLATLLRPSRLKRPETHLLGVGFVVMWLPALLASPPVHALRPVGLLPFYMVTVTAGLFSAAQLAPRFLRRTRYAAVAQKYSLPVLAVIALGATLLLNSVDYFGRYAHHPEVYKEYNGPIADLSTQIRELTRTEDVIVPLAIYLHPTVRTLLHDEFTELPGPPPDTGRPVEMLLTPEPFQLLYVANIPDSPAMARLSRDAAGRGQVFVSRPPRNGEQEAINQMLGAAVAQARPFTDRLGRNLAQFVPLSPADDSRLRPLFVAKTPRRAVSVQWDQQAELLGYEVFPEVIQPGQPLTINFYWRSLTDAAFEPRLFLQIVNRNGEPATQWEGPAFAEDMYRWRPGGILPTRHTLWLGPDTPPGVWFVRLGFFNPDDGARLPITALNGAPPPEPTDQVQLGAFTVSPDGAPPPPPAAPLDVTFGDAIRLAGVTVPQLQLTMSNEQLTITNEQLSMNNEQTSNSPNPPNSSNSINLTFYWQAVAPTDRPYTVFLQLLDDGGQVVAGWDSQPFNGIYPTHLWSPGESLADTFGLPLPPEGLPPGAYRLITGFYDVNTGQRLPASTGGDAADLARFSVK